MVVLQGGKSTVCSMQQFWGQGTRYSVPEDPPGPAPDGSENWRQSSLMLSLQEGRERRRQPAWGPPSPFSLCLKLWSRENPPFPNHAFKAGSNNTTATPCPRVPVCLRGTVLSSVLYTQGLQEVSPWREQRRLFQEAGANRWVC